MSALDQAADAVVDRKPQHDGGAVRKYHKGQTNPDTPVTEEELRGPAPHIKPKFAGADPNILAQQAQQQAVAQHQQMQQQLDQKKNMLLGVAVNAPFSFEDGWAHSVHKAGNPKNITQTPADRFGAFTEKNCSRLISAHAELCIEWAKELTNQVHNAVESQHQTDLSKARSMAAMTVSEMKDGKNGPN